MVRTYIKRVHGAVEANDADAAGTALSQAVPIIDKMVTKGIMHKNQAAQAKSRLNKRVSRFPHKCFGGGLLRRQLLKPLY